MTYIEYSNIVTGYPSEVQQQLTDLTNLVVDVIKPKALYLLGSAARGELSWMRHPSGNLELFSDYELVIITQHRTSNKKRHALLQKIHSLERQIGNPNPLFHIDLVFREQRRLASMPHIIFTFEFKQNGLLLFGEELRDAIPDVTLISLDSQNTNEILYKRLWALLLYLPEFFIYGNLNIKQRRVAGYSFCRNALDLTTVFLPREGYLLSTYRQRVNTLISKTESLNICESFDNDFPAFMQMCLNRRIDLNFSQTDLLPLYVKTIGYLEHVILRLLQDTSYDTLPKLSHRVFNEYPISRGEWYNLIRMTLDKARRYGSLKAIRWMRLPVKGWLALGLLMMHKSLICWMHSNTQEAEEYLRHTEHALQTITLEPFHAKKQDFPGRWLALRRSWGEVWLQTIRMGAKSAEERINSVMDWHYE